MAATTTTLKSLCTPAYLYFLISVISYIALLFQNAGNSTVYCLGSFQCHVPSTALVFVAKAVYIIFWTFILNCVCKAGYTNISWLLLLLPFILFFILIGLLILRQGVIMTR